MTEVFIFYMIFRAIEPSSLENVAVRYKQKTSMGLVRIPSGAEGRDLKKNKINQVLKTLHRLTLVYAQFC